MHRCTESAGEHEVRLEVIEEIGDDGKPVADKSGMRVQIGPHANVWEDVGPTSMTKGCRLEMPDRPGDFALNNREPGGPWELVEPEPTVSEDEPYVGEICTHELAYLRGLPGRDFSAHWRYTVTPKGK